MQLIVIKDSDNIAIGKIEASFGMRLTNGYEIIKVNSKNVIASDRENYKETFFSPVSIYYTEAKSWGFSNSEVDDSTEDFAATKRKFRWGEEAYSQYLEHGYVLPLRNSAERAGYEFALKVQEMRSLEIQHLMEQEVLEIAQ